MNENNSGLKPFHKRVLLRADPPKTTSTGGVLLTKEQHDDRTAVIVAIGDDAFEGWTNPPKVGTRVLHFGAVEVETGPQGERYWLADDGKLAVSVEYKPTLTL